MPSHEKISPRPAGHRAGLRRRTRPVEEIQAIRASLFAETAPPPAAALNRTEPRRRRSTVLDEEHARLLRLRCNGELGVRTEAAA